MFKSYKNNRKSFLLWGGSLGAIAIIATNFITAQSVSNDRRNQASSYDQTRGEHYPGRLPYSRVRPVSRGAEASAVSTVRMGSQPVRSQPSPTGFGPSHSTVIRDGLKYVIGSMSFPTGLRAHDGLLLEKIVPAEMMVGTPFSYEYRVTNLTPHPIHVVRLMDQVSSGFRIRQSVPQPASTAGGVVVWDIGKLEGNASRKVRIQGVAAAEGIVTTCGWATYSPVLCEPIRIVKASLQVVKNGPAEVSICDPIQYTIRVKNTGSSTLTGVRLVERMDDGVSLEGRGEVAFDIGTLEPGETRQVAVSARAERTGTFVNRVMATSAQGVTAEDSVSTVVLAPEIAVSCEAPKVRFIGRPVEVCFKVANQGSAVADNAAVEALVPEGGSVRGVTGGGRIVGDRIQWNLGELAPGENKAVCAQLIFGTAGIFRLAGQVQADCVDPVRTVCQTEIRGVPGVLLEVIDLGDPIEVGATGTYEITVTNQGTAMDTNIAIQCVLEPAQEFVSASGATRGVEVEPRIIRFPPLPSLAPKQIARWRVVVRAVSREDVRFKVTLKTDQISRPVEETEATNQY
ncbi:MAG: Large cysteine-rich periplasmic protein OmcB [Verrucomicrobia subdivision 3 bacterium]|nr:Large cysteine-rich periplasmic protein OmcB [Limisphaerales bacterium]MCS1412451.1 Large cysteine-rich periplasmic protein OmcB [Limisphaerales bacterium]